MAFGLNLNVPVAPGASSTQTDQPNETRDETKGATSSTDNSTAAERSSGASQTSEAKQTQTVAPANTDVAVARADKSDIAVSAKATEMSETVARQFAVRARAETIVAALVDAISAPIAPSELAAVDAAEAELKRGEAQQIAARGQNERLEDGLSSVRADSQAI